MGEILERTMMATKPTTCATATEIARAAARLFSETGYDATPVRAIAEAVGVTCPTLYYHFGSKEELAQALLTRPLLRIEETIRGLLDEPIGPLERLERVAEAYFAFSREDPERARFLYAVMFGPLGKGLAAEVDAIFRRLNGLLVRVVEGLAEAGVIAPDAATDLTLSLRGQIVIRTMNFLYRGGQLDPELARRVVGRVLLGHAEDAARTGLEARYAGSRNNNEEPLGV